MAKVSVGNLDFLRGAAAVYVVVAHARSQFYAGGNAMVREAGGLRGLDLHELAILAMIQLTTVAREAVVLFFVLSGFAMAHSLSRNAAVGGFYLRRAIRIWPPYLAAVALAAFVSMLIVNMDVAPLSAEAAAFLRLWRLAEVSFYIYPATYVSGQFWSLPYEVVFYLACPFLLVSERRIRIALVLTIVSALVMIPFVGLRFNASTSFWANLAAQEAFFFLVGAFAYHHFHRVPALTGRRLAAACVVGLALVLGIRMALGYSNLPGNVVVVGLAVLLIRNLPDRVGQHRWFNLGFCSYSIYLFHEQVLMLIYATVVDRTGVTRGGMGNPAVWLLFVPVAIGVAMLLYVVTERPASRAVAKLRGGAAPRDKRAWGRGSA